MVGTPTGVVTTTITVDAQAAPGGDIKPPDAKQAGKTSIATPATPQVNTQFSPVVDMSGVDKSAVYRINPG